MNSKKFEDFINNCDAELRTGRFHQISENINKLSLTQLTPNQRLELAKICRRAGLTTKGLKLLAPVARPEDPKSKVPPQAACEYSALLLRIGSATEAYEILATIDFTKVPEVLLHKAFCQMGLWNHQHAIVLLEAYLRTEPAPYTALITKVNLAAALVSAGQYQRAESQLKENIDEARKHSHRRLLANSLELLGEVCLEMDRKAECQAALGEATKILGPAQTIDRLMIEKWTAVLEARETGTIDRLISVQSQAALRGHWETVRDAEFHILRIRFNDDTYRKLIFGTPHAPFRQRAQQILARDIGKHEYIFGSQKGPRLDLLTGAVSGTAHLNAGKKLHQLLDLLLRDFYAPVRVGRLFAGLFPGEYFDIFSSSHRVHQIIWRARQWLSENKIPVSIIDRDGAIHLEIRGEFGFVVPFERAPVEPNEVAFRVLVAKLAGQQSFTTAEAQSAIGISRQGVQRLLTWAQANHRLVQHGGGRLTRYQFVNLPGALAAA